MIRSFHYSVEPLNGGAVVTKDRRDRRGKRGKGWERRRGRWTGLVAAHKPTLRTITVTNHIVFVATTHRNTS